MISRSFNPSLLSILLFIALLLAGVSAAPASTDTETYEPTFTATATGTEASAEATSESTAEASIEASVTDSEGLGVPTLTPSATLDTAGDAVPSVIVPKAFDSSIPSENFTSYTCYPFFTSFLQNKTFTDCFPLSFYLQNSRSWFNILKEGQVAVTQALDKSCNVDVQKCQAVMDDFGRQLLSMNNCGQEFKARNPTVTQAYASFLTYSELFSVGCLKDKKTGNYCYAKAATNGDNLSDAYVYFLPLGVQLPGGSRLTCSSCLQQTMMVYASYAGNSTLPLFNTYTPSAQQIDIGCGPAFVNTTASIQSSSTSIWSINSSTRWLSCITLIASIVLLVA